MARSVYRNKDFNKIIDKLTERNPVTGVAVFPTIKALQCFAAVLGFDRKRRVELDRSNIDGIEWHTFSNDKLTRYIFLIALAETKDLNVLKYDESGNNEVPQCGDMVKIFEEYANGGFEILSSWLDKTPGDPYGEKAIMVAMSKAKYLEVEEQSVSEVEF